MRCRHSYPRLLAAMAGLLLATSEAAPREPDRPPGASIPPPRDPEPARPFPRPEGPAEGGEESGHPGTRVEAAAIAVSIGLLGAGALALISRRGRTSPSGTLQVLARTSLSPRHAVYLLRAGDHILIVGAGAQGPPALLGELTDEQERRRLLSGYRGGTPAGDRDAQPVDGPRGAS